MCAACGPAKETYQEPGVAVQRVVSLAPSLTEAMFALGAGDLLVGRSNYCTYPADALEVPAVGRIDSPKLERILAFRPGLVLVTPLTPKDVIERIRGMGLRVLSLRADRLEDITETYRQLGVLFSRQAEAVELTREIEHALAAAEANAGMLKGKRPRACLLYGFEAPYFSAGRGTFPSALLERAGFENLANRAPLAWPQLNLEWLVDQNPDCIFIASSGSARTAEMELTRMQANAVWEQVTAIRKGQLYLIPGDALSIPGQRAIDALRIFSKAWAEIEIP